MLAADMVRSTLPWDRGGGLAYIPPSHTRADADDFRVGDVVIAQGLASNPTYNGLEGRVVGNQRGDFGEQQVLVVFSGYGPKAKALLKTNLINKTTLEANRKVDARGEPHPPGSPRSRLSSMASSHPPTTPRLHAASAAAPPPNGVYTGQNGHYAAASKTPLLDAQPQPQRGPATASVQVIKDAGETDLGCILNDMVLRGVRPDSPAARAGVAQYVGLRLVEVDGVSVHSRTSASVANTLMNRVVTLSFEVPPQGVDAARREARMASPRPIPPPAASSYPEYAQKQQTPARPSLIVAAADAAAATAVVPATVSPMGSPRQRPRITSYAAQQGEDEAKEKIIASLREENASLKERVAVAEAIAARADQEAARLREQVAMLLGSIRQPTQPPEHTSIATPQSPRTPPALTAALAPPSPTFALPARVAPLPTLSPPSIGNILPVGQATALPPRGPTLGPPVAGQIIGPAPQQPPTVIAQPPAMPPPAAPAPGGYRMHSSNPHAAHLAAMHAHAATPQNLHTHPASMQPLPPSVPAAYPPPAAMNPFSSQYAQALAQQQQQQQQQQGPPAAPYPRRAGTEPPSPDGPPPPVPALPKVQEAPQPVVKPHGHGSAGGESVYPYGHVRQAGHAAAGASASAAPLLFQQSAHAQQHTTPQAGRGTERLPSSQPGSGGSRQPSPPWEQQQPEPQQLQRPASVIV